MSQQEVKAEFTEDNREQIQMEHLGDSERKGAKSLIFVQVLGGFIEDGGLLYMSPQAFRNWLEQRRAQMLFLGASGPWHQDV